MDIGISKMLPWKALAAIFQHCRRKPIFSYQVNQSLWDLNIGFPGQRFQIYYF